MMRRLKRPIEYGKGIRILGRGVILYSDRERPHA